MGQNIILPLKIYEIQNGNVEHYLWDQDWFLCYDDRFTNSSTQGPSSDSASGARGAIGLGNVSVIKHTISGMGYTGFRNVDFDYYIGKRIRCRIKNTGSDDIYFEMNVARSTGSLSETLSYPWDRIYHYRNGNLIFTSTLGAMADYQLYTNDNTRMSGQSPIPWINPSHTRIVRPEIRGHFDSITETYSYDYYVKTWSDSTLISNYLNWLNGYDPVIPDDDNPYYNGGTSDKGGGGGNFSDDSDTVDEDQLPVIDAIGTGFATLFTPSKAQLKALADVMWNNNIFTALQNLVENITNMFTSLAIVPFEVTQGSTVEVTWLGLPITELFLTLASKQYYEFDMGSIDMTNDSRIYTSGSALDYSPFSKLGIFLPFIGFQELDIDECRDATIGLKYRIDILSGTCVALISINGNTIYQFSGNCLSQIPITNENMQSLVADAVNIGIAATTAHAASGVASAEMSAAGNTEIQSLSDLDKANKATAHAQSHLGIARGHLASATANAAMGLKPTFGKAGSISASASLLAVKQPYLFLTTPNQCIPDHYQRYCGFPSNISGKLSTFSGFTVVENIRLNGLVATSPEVGEIYELLKNGVII